MKKKLTQLAIFACFVTAIFLMYPVRAMAGGIWAEIQVKYIILTADGGWEYCAVQSEEDYLGVTAELTCPDSSIMTDTIESIDSWGSGPDGQSLPIGSHRFFLAWETDVSKMLPGVYTLTKSDYPKGYEYDNAMEDKYPLSVTLTQQDITDYVEWASTFDGADGEVYYIYVPVKKIGTQSAVFKKPEKAELAAGNNNLSVELKGTAGKYSAEIQYASEKDGRYETLASDIVYYFNAEGCPLKHGKTYYFRARYYKAVNGENIYGDFGDPIAIKVCKSFVTESKPVLSVNTRSSSLKVTHSGETNYGFKLSYAAKKKGKYKEIADTYYGTDLPLSGISQLKKGKTYYVKVRFIDEQGSEILYSSYSKIKKVKK